MLKVHYHTNKHLRLAEWSLWQAQLPGRLGVIILLFIFNSTLASGFNKLDSLIQKLESITDDIEKVELLIDIGTELYNSDLKASNDFGQRALDLSKKISYQKGEASSLNLIGVTHEISGKFPEAMSYYQSALEIAETSENDDIIPGIKNSIALVHENLGDYDKAMVVFHEILSIAEAKQDNEMKSMVLNNIGNIHAVQKDHKKALGYYEKSLAIERKLDYPLGISIALTNIGDQYKELGEFAKAGICLNEALNISIKINDRAGEAIILSSIGELQQKKGLLDLAAAYYPRALKISDEIGDKVSSIKTRIAMARLENERENYEESIQLATESLNAAREIGQREQVKESLGILAVAYAAVNDYEQAYSFHQQYSASKDSLYNKERNKQIVELSTRYETAKKDAENKILKEQQAINEKIIRRRTYISVAITAALGIMSLLAFILFFYNRQKQEYNKKLKEEVHHRTLDLEHSNEQLRTSNKELERFAYIASHDLKEPLRNIMSFTRLLERKLPEEFKSNPEIEEYLAYICNNTIQMHSLIEDVLEFSRIDSKIKLEEVDINEIGRSVVKMLNSTIRDQNVEIKFGTLPKVRGNYAKLFVVLKNLIENGIKYNNSYLPKIWVQSRRIGDMEEISVTDNGIGIEAEFNEQIFDMFKRLHNREKYQGSGLGLAICKKIVQSLHGDIKVESEPGKGSKFLFTLPAAQPSEDSLATKDKFDSALKKTKLELNN